MIHFLNVKYSADWLMVILSTIDGNYRPSTRRDPSGRSYFIIFEKPVFQKSWTAVPRLDSILYLSVILLFPRMSFCHIITLITHFRLSLVLLSVQFCILNFCISFHCCYLPYRSHCKFLIFVSCPVWFNIFFYYLG